MTLQGCIAIPPAVTLASFGVDLGSFALTGKTATDHVLSAVAGEDCRLLGALEGEICREEREFEAALAILQPLPPEPDDLQTAESGAPRERQLPTGFQIPSGTIVEKDPELPVGGFALDGTPGSVQVAAAQGERAAAAEPLDSEIPEGFEVPSGSVAEVDGEEASETAVPEGFEVPTGTVMTKAKELPIGGFAADGGRVALAYGNAEKKPAKENTAGELPLSGFLADGDLLRAAPDTSESQLSHQLDKAVFLSQASLMPSAAMAGISN